MKKWFFLAAMLFAVPVMAEVSSAKVAGGIADPAAGWNRLWHHLMIDLWAIGIVFGGIALVFIFKYKRQREDQEGDMPRMNMGQSMAWALVPAFIFMADDFYLAANGWKLWIDQRTVPENAMEVKTTASMYNWSFEFVENGAASDMDITIPVGQPVVFRMVSDDSIHSLFIPDFRIKEDVMPGRITYLWINPVREGEHVLTCTEYCGVGHSNMFGKVKIVSPEKFEAWAAENKV